MSATSIGELEAQIDAAPDDDALYAVYGDLLARRGDPRGELIALQLAAQAQTGKAADKLRALATKYLTTHAAALLGPLAPHADALTWRSGFIRRIELASSPRVDVAAVVAQVLPHPSGRFVVELALKLEGADEADRVLAVLAEAAPRAVRQLEVVARVGLGLAEMLEPRRDDERALELADVLARVPLLERLVVTARGIELGEVALPHAERVQLAAATLTATCMRAVVRAAWPELERLELRFGTRGALPATFEDVRPLLARADVPALTHLRLRNAPFAGAIVRTLVGAPLFAQLQVVDLSHGSMTPADAAFVVANAAAFAHLRELWLPMRHLRPADRTALAALGKHVVGDQRAALDQTDKLLGLAP